MSEVCPNVGTDPLLQPATDKHLAQQTANGEDGAQLDVAAESFWSGSNRGLHENSLKHAELRTAFHRSIEGTNLMDARQRASQKALLYFVGWRGACFPSVYAHKSCSVVCLS